MGERISVIIPVYNGERFLAEAIQSVLDQTLPPDEIIVMDDGSTDGSAAVVARCAAQSRLPIRYVFQQNAGPAAARNRGLDLTCSEIIAFQDADDLWTEGRLAIQVGLLARHPSAYAVIGRTRFIYEDTVPAGCAALSPHWFLGIHSGLYRRAAFEVVGPFNASLRYHEDIDWFRRARAAGLGILPHEDVVLLHRRHAGNITNDHAALRRELLHMLRQAPRGHAATAESLLAWLTDGIADRLEVESPYVREWGVSVVIPVYNGARYLSEAIQSMLAQTEAPREIILVDDGSTDDSAALIQRLAATTTIPLRYVHQANQGTAAARNRGIKLAAGPLIAFLDQDDLWLPEKLARQCDLLRRQPAAGYSITQVESFMDNGGPPPAWLRAGWLAEPQAVYLPSSLLVRRSTFQQVGVFDPTLRNGSDIDWFARVRSAGVAVAIASEVLVRYRIHSGNQSQFARENQREYYEIARRALQRKRLQNAESTE